MTDQATQGSATAPLADPPIRLNRSIAVLLRRDGVFLPRVGTLPEARIGLPVLELIVALAGDEPVAPRSVVRPLAERHGIEPISLRIQLKKLKERGFLSHETAGPRAVPAPAGRSSSPIEALPPVSADEALVVSSPRLLRVEAGSFELLDHEGALVARLTPVELAAAGELSHQATVADAERAHQREAGDHALGSDHLRELAARLLDAGVLERQAECRANAREQALTDRSWTRAMKARDSLRDHFLAEAERTEELVARTGMPRTPVVPIHTQFTTPLSLGMIVAYAQQFDGGRLLDHFSFMPAVLIDPNLPQLSMEPEIEPFVDRGAVFLFSNYVWSHGTNLATSERIKARNPNAITVHGGPDSPKYEGDVEAYFEANPFIDVVVHGEGEATFSALLDALAAVVVDEVRDLSVLAGVEGLSFRGPDGIVRNPPRDRIVDVNDIPSPYLTGIYEAYGDGAIDTAMIETNRGCPYSCTFCDWGSSTNSRIRKFDLERVFAELEWCARNQVSRIFFCDANFGIFERDVEIAQKVGDLRKQYGYPQALTTNYAKNTVKHLQKIVQIMAESGVVTEGLLSLQSMDDDTLKTIRRSNIKVEKYDALAAEFREAELPLLVDLMIGLPGSTTASLREDFQQCIDREVNAKVFQTELLVNSPMNDPVYRAENQIVTERVDGTPSERIPTKGTAGAGRALVVSSSSFTRADYDEMLQLRAVFRLVENFAVLRIVARYARQMAGIREGDFIEALRATAHEEPDRWPTISLGMRAVPEHMVPPVSWKPLIDEIRAFLVERLGVPTGSALDAVLDVQHAVLPSLGRQFPQTIELPHDVGAWYRDVLRAKDEGHRTTWPDHVPLLETYGPTSFTIDDPEALCEVGLGFGVDTDPYASWELHSPVARHLASHHTVLH
jgi:hypothetical protein